jgi:tetrahydromethanopterin S-methyltransferase subunit B
MKIDEKMKKLNNLANAINKATDPGLKKLWTDKWYQLVRQYAATIQ